MRPDTSDLVNAEYGFPVEISVIDVAASWMRKDHRGRALPETDWRFHARLPSGGRVTFGEDTTAAEVARYLQNEKIEPKDVPL